MPHREDSQHQSGDYGELVLGVRNDTAGALANADGDYTPFQLDSAGNLRVSTPAGATTPSKAEDSAHADGDTGMMILAVRRDTAAVGSNADGDYSTVNVDSTGRVWTNTELPDAAALADGASNPTTPMAGACGQDFNGTTWDRRRGNAEVTVFSSAARTATTNSSDVTNYNARGVRLTLDITNVSGVGPTLDVKIQGKDTLSGAYVDIAGAAFTQKTATGTDELVIYPGVAETANESVSDIIPRVFRAVATIGGTTPSFTFSLGASLIV